MTGRIRKTTLLSLCGLVAAVSALAPGPGLNASGIPLPDPTKSTCPGCTGPGSLAPFIPFVGLQAPPGNMAAHHNQALMYTIRDFSGNPIAGAAVDLNVIGCSDLVLCEYIPTGPGSGQWVPCTPRVIRGITNALGQVTMVGMGAGNIDGSGSGPGAGLNCVQIATDGVHLSNATAVIFDLNGAGPGDPVSNNGLNAQDMFVLGSDIFANSPVGGNIYHGRSDYSAIPNPTNVPAQLGGCSGAGDCGIVNGFDLFYFAALLFDSTGPGGNEGSSGGCSSFTPTELAGINYCP